MENKFKKEEQEYFKWEENFGRYIIAFLRMPYTR